MICDRPAVRTRRTSQGSMISSGDACDVGTRRIPSWRNAVGPIPSLRKLSSLDSTDKRSSVHASNEPRFARVIISRALLAELEGLGMQRGGGQREEALGHVFHHGHHEEVMAHHRQTNRGACCVHYGQCCATTVHTKAKPMPPHLGLLHSFSAFSLSSGPIDESIILELLIRHPFHLGGRGQVVSSSRPRKGRGDFIWRD
jgi:hypothetical protein